MGEAPLREIQRLLFPLYFYVPGFVLPDHLFYMEMCLCHECSLKDITYCTKTKGVYHK